MSVCERSDCNPETCAHSSHRKVRDEGWGHPSTWPTSEDWAAFWGDAQTPAPKVPKHGACNDCGTSLVLSEDQTPCIFTLLFEEHGNQQWLECPGCDCIWETNEVGTTWRCVTLGEDNLDDFVETLNAIGV